MNQAEVLKNSVGVPEGAILTYTGRFFKPLNPQAEDVDPIDIAHALSNQCRYTGHVRKFYSVAEHCVIIHDYLEKQDHHALICLSALLHDADEAYLLDLAAPVKHHSNGFGTRFRQVAAEIQDAICVRFNLPISEFPIVKEMDMRLRTNEMEELFTNPPRIWGDPLPVKIRCWTPQKAKEEFLWRLKDYNLVQNYKGEWTTV